MTTPNPWISIPALIAGLVGGALGWIVTNLACRVEGGPASDCPVAATTVALVGFLGATVGMAVVLSLVYRSLGEWRELRNKPHNPR
jgi:hypothetical protein